MTAHAMEFLTAGSNQAEVLLHEERDNLGGISVMELHRLVHAQVLSSHILTWQVSPNHLKHDYISNLIPKSGLVLGLFSGVEH